MRPTICGRDEEHFAVAIMVGVQHVTNNTRRLTMKQLSGVTNTIGIATPDEKEGERVLAYRYETSMIDLHTQIWSTSLWSTIKANPRKP